MNFWNKLMGSIDAASIYMDSYGEGVGSETRDTIGAFINDDESVLDVGTGPGWNYAHFKTYGPDITYKGTDYSDYMVQGAKKKFPEANFELGDCRNIEEADDSWDVVLLQDVLEHTNGYEKPVQEALRVAKKRVIISFWHLTDEDNPHINDNADDGWGAWYDKREWEKFLNSLPYPWMDTESKPDANRQHLFYIINKEPWK